MSEREGVSPQPDDLGLSIDMLDADRLLKWAENIESCGPDITRWGSTVSIAQKCRELSANIAQAVRDIGALRSHRLEPTPEPPTASVDEKASKWLKATMLSKGRDEDTLPTAVDRAVRRVLGSCSGQSLHRQLVILVRELAPTGAPSPCVWRPVKEDSAWLKPACRDSALSFLPAKAHEFAGCPYCLKPLTVER